MKEIPIGEIIRQRRLELGLTQEELCEGVCEPPTLSRIEGGKQTPSSTKLSVLLQRLGLPGNKYYALLSAHELEIEKLKNEVISCNMRRDRREGLEKLEQLIASADNEDHLTQQFILRSKVLLGSMENGDVRPYSFEKKLEMLYQAIHLTLPSFDLGEVERYWYSVDEMKIINQIAITYGSHDLEQKSIDIYEQFFAHLQKHELQTNSDSVPIIIIMHYISPPIATALPSRFGTATSSTLSMRRTMRLWASTPTTLSAGTPTFRPTRWI